MISRRILIVAGVCLLAQPLAAQTIGTQCWNASNGTLQCNSNSGIIYVPDYTARVAQQLSATLAGILELRRERQAAAHMREQDLARQRAMAQLFSERARDVVATVVNTTHLEGVVAQHFIEASASSLEALYVVSPTAAQSEMLEAVLPHYRQVMSDFGAFMQGNLPAYEGQMRAVGASLSPEQRTAMANELAASLASLYMNRPDASAEDFRQTIMPFFAKYTPQK